MRTTECSRTREALRSGAVTSRDERHLFTCAGCRAEARIDAAWKSLPRPFELEVPEPVDEVFVARVLEAVRQHGRRRRHDRLRLAAAAALLFFFFAGLAQKTASQDLSAAEEAYAQLAAPSAFDGLLPK